MDIKMMRVEDIIPYAKNPRKNDSAVDGVAASIKEFGFKVPIVIDSKNVIVAGHTRYKAAKKLGLTSVPCIVADDLSPKQIKAFRLADNKVSEVAEWDDDLLNLELGDLADFDMSAFGFELSKLKREVVEDEFDGETPETPLTQVGDLWVLGRHRLLCGDATSKEAVAVLVNGAKVDMWLTDPPYNVDYTGGTKDKLKIENDKLPDEKFRKFLVDAFAAARSVMKPGAVFYIWHADSEGFNFRGACKDVGLIVRQCLIWVKNTLVMGRQDYHWKHEPCLYGWDSTGAHLWTANRKQTTVLNFDRPTRSKDHPTMKPVKLFDYQIKNNTKEDALVLDTFMGSGTTLAACEQGGRTCFGMELDPKYCDVIARRYIGLAGRDGVKLMRNGVEVQFDDV